uniref:Uncharacterized protein n=1 Tax=Aegilops tauschii subsp. strangulata TaxID=200361 RepID=A0A453N2X2_AEGTS
GLQSTPATATGRQEVRVLDLSVTGTSLCASQYSRFTTRGGDWEAGTCWHGQTAG